MATIDFGFGTGTYTGTAADDLFTTSSVSSSSQSALGTIDGGGGFDTVDVSKVAPTGLGLGKDQNGNFVPVLIVGGQEIQLKSIEKIIFGNDDHSLVDITQGLSGVSVVTGSGADDITVEASSTVDAGGGNDTISISGSFGGDPINASIDGGAGVDTLKLNIAFDVDLAAGTATSGSAVYALAGIENVEATTAGYATSVAGDDQANRMSVSSFSDDGTTGVSFDGRGGDDVLSGSAGDDTLIGGTGDDTLTGGAGNDVLDGGARADRMIGGNGDDTYYVDDSEDKVIEAVNGGNDIVFSSVNFSLAGQYVETLTLTGTLAQFAIGNSQANVLIGNSNANIIEGGGGVDTMSGGTGNDTYYVDNSSAKVIEGATGGNDLIYSSTSYNLAGQYIETLTLTGNANINGTGNSQANVLNGNDGNNVLSGLDGNDRLSGGGGGNDTLIGGNGDDWLGDVGSNAVMIGGDGNDTYSVASARDVINEAADGGSDMVYAYVDFTVGSQSIEKIMAYGVTVTAGDQTTSLYGGNSSEKLIGGSSGDLLDGGGGADTLIGGDGNDTYYVDNSKDKVVEGATGGNDLVYASASFDLAGQYVETLTLTGTANINATGNSQANTLNGNSGNNVLDGKGGLDTMAGGLGNDTYYADNANDRVIEAANGGTDIVYASASFSLAGQYIETLQLTGTAYKAIGNTQANTLIGNDAANLLDGMGGSDTLTGGGGADTFLFDSALGSGNIDGITDFTVGTDLIALDHTVFAAAGAAGALSAAAFGTGAAATTAAQRILYDGATGNLWYDADGSGAGAAVKFATVTAGLALTAASFKIA